MDASDLLRESVKTNTKDLFKDFLVLVEDLSVDHEINFKKLYNNLPEEYHAIIDQADYLDEDKVQYLRKKILDIGNNTIRKFESQSEKFTISFKFK